MKRYITTALQMMMLFICAATLPAFAGNPMSAAGTLHNDAVRYVHTHDTIDSTPEDYIDLLVEFGVEFRGLTDTPELREHLKLVARTSLAGNGTLQPVTAVSSPAVDARLADYVAVTSSNTTLTEMKIAIDALDASTIAEFSGDDRRALLFSSAVFRASLEMWADIIANDPEYSLSAGQWGEVGLADLRGASDGTLSLPTRILFPTFSNTIMGLGSAAASIIFARETAAINRIYTPSGGSGSDGFWDDWWNRCDGWPMGNCN